MPEDPGTLDNLDDTQSTVNWQEHIPEEYRGKGYWEPLKDKSLSDVQVWQIILYLRTLAN